MRSPLDIAYDARGTVSIREYEAIVHRYRTQSDLAIADLDGVMNVAYDSGSDNRLDIWGTVTGQLRPAVLAIHGGYWRANSRHDTAFMSKMLADAGVITIPVDYDLCPSVTLEEIVRQIRSAVAWVHRSGREHGIDPSRLYVIGSSAGGHLAAMTAVGAWQQDRGLPPCAVAGIMAISGLFDLRPLVDAFPNEWLRLTPRTAELLSPALAKPTPIPAVFAIAEHEAAAFTEQTHRFASHWPSPPAVIDVPARNHFDVFLDLTDPESSISRALLELIHADPSRKCASR